jgi:hypothetical protein
LFLSLLHHLHSNITPMHEQQLPLLVAHCKCNLNSLQSNCCMFKTSIKLPYTYSVTIICLSSKRYNCGINLMLPSTIKISWQTLCGLSIIIISSSQHFFFSSSFYSHKLHSMTSQYKKPMTFSFKVNFFLHLFLILN